MREYVKPEIEIIKFTTESITSNPDMVGGVIESGYVTDEE